VFVEVVQHVLRVDEVFVQCCDERVEPGWRADGGQEGVLVHGEECSCSGDVVDALYVLLSLFRGPRVPDREAVCDDRWRIGRVCHRRHEQGSVRQTDVTGVRPVGGWRPQRLPAPDRTGGRGRDSSDDGG